MNHKNHAGSTALLVFIISFFMLLVSSCSGTVSEGDRAGANSTTDIKNDIPTETSAGTDLPEPSDPSEPEKKYVGIETVDYPNIDSIYGWDMMTESQKKALSYFNQIIIKVFETDGKENVSVRFDEPISNRDVGGIKGVYASAFPFITYLRIMDHKTGNDVTDFYYEVGSTDDSVFEEYRYSVKAAHEILASLEHDGTEYGKAYAIARWITENIEYPGDYRALEEQGADLRSIYSVLKNHQAVCEGYAEVFNFLCRMAQLNTINVVNGIHQWNMIEIDGKWYHVDTTWMNPGNFYEYFMMPEDVSVATGHDDARITYKGAFSGYSIPLPKADSFDLYRNYFKSCEDFISYLSNINPTESDYTYQACFDSDNEFEKLKALRGSLIKNADGNEYYLALDKNAENKYSVCVNLIKKR